jgi:hypothetical protein
MDDPLVMFTKAFVGGRCYKLRYATRALYNHGSLPHPLALSLIADDEAHSFAALCQWLWACIDEPHKFGTPADLADAIKRDEVNDAVKALAQAIKIGRPPEEDRKNANGSTPSPSPASSSE